ncbi:hypothetical protein, partial [Mangrovihabitans endophyticus]|uniref:hypothetical protein n=1 Tax=Mangrovihabitans endophyticus TaxID=1751298 RepID=UPI001E366461
DFTGWYPDAGRVPLPTYAFDHRRYWPQPRENTGDSDDVDARFWAAVENADPADLAGDLAVDADALSRVLPALSGWRRHQRDQSLLDALRFHERWCPITGPTATTPAGPWVVVAHPEADAADVTDALGADCLRLDVADRRHAAEQLRDLPTDLGGVVSLLACRDGSAADGPDAVAGNVILLQALQDAGVDAPLWCLTRGAVTVDGAEPVTAPAQAATWGFGRVAALEYPRQWGGLIDLPATTDPAALARLTDALGGMGGEDQIALRAAGVYARHLAPARAGADGGGWTPRGAVLITGGTGGRGSRSPAGWPRTAPATWCCSAAA